MNIKESVCNFFDELTTHIKKMGKEEELSFTEKDMKDAMTEVLKDIENREGFEIGEKGDLDLSEYEGLKGEARQIYNYLIKLQDNVEMIEKIESTLNLNEKRQRLQSQIEGVEKALEEQERGVVESLVGEKQTLNEVQANLDEQIERVIDFLRENGYKSVAVRNKARDVVFRLKGTMKAGTPSLSITKFYQALKKFSAVLDKAGLAKADFWGQLWAEGRGIEKYLETEVLEKGKDIGISKRKKLKESVSSVQEIYAKLDWITDVGEKMKRVWKWVISLSKKMFASLQNMSSILENTSAQLDNDVVLFEELDERLFTEASVEEENIGNKFSSFIDDGKEDKIGIDFLKEMG